VYNVSRIKLLSPNKVQPLRPCFEEREFDSHVCVQMMDSTYCQHWVKVCEKRPLCSLLYFVEYIHPFSITSVLPPNQGGMFLVPGCLPSSLAISACRYSTLKNDVERVEGQSIMNISLRARRGFKSMVENSTAGVLRKDGHYLLNSRKTRISAWFSGFPYKINLVRETPGMSLEVWVSSIKSEALHQAARRLRSAHIFVLTVWPTNVSL
jgi:hypothetical protein